MGGFFTGFLTGAFLSAVIMQLSKQKRLTFKGWVSKTESNVKFWLTTSVYAVLAVALLFYMVYS